MTSLVSTGSSLPACLAKTSRDLRRLGCVADLVVVRFARVVLAASSAALFVGCASPIGPVARNTAGDGDRLIGQWRDIGPMPPTGGNHPLTMDFRSDGSYSFHDYCNQTSGRWSVETSNGVPVVHFANGFRTLSNCIPFKDVVSSLREARLRDATTLDVDTPTLQFVFVRVPEAT